MIKQSNTTPPKLNDSTIVDTDDNEEDEISHKAFKTMIIRMTNKIKDDMNKCLNKFQENTNKLLNEIRHCRV
jgi:acetyl-CoA carboxylase alpha subunit